MKQSTNTVHRIENLHLYQWSGLISENTRIISGLLKDYLEPELKKLRNPAKRAHLSAHSVLSTILYSLLGKGVSKSRGEAILFWSVRASLRRSVAITELYKDLMDTFTTD